ncbi:MAG: prepilin-type N-terminal cleavage/methylation domain-containing protein [Desulfobacterium sp.]|nr:prepilin-type N-terminal cleavage/methylation domain-containing protein [Desulfobacterium sp.]
MRKNTRQNGFTLIEVLLAILLLAFGILSVGVMQNSSIQGNKAANNLTEAATWSSDKLEALMARPFADLIDHNADGMAGINNIGVDDGTPDPDPPPADGQPKDHGIFTVVWNVVDNYPVFGTKTIRVIVQRRDRGVLKTISMDFTRMEPI